MKVANFNHWLVESGEEDRDFNWLVDLGLVGPVDQAKHRIIKLISEDPAVTTRPATWTRIVSLGRGRVSPADSEYFGLGQLALGLRNCIVEVKAKVKLEHNQEFAENTGIPIYNYHEQNEVWDKVMGEISEYRIEPDGTLTIRLKFKPNPAAQPKGRERTIRSFHAQQREKTQKRVELLSAEINEVVEGVWFVVDDLIKDDDELARVYDSLLRTLAG